MDVVIEVNIELSSSAVLMKSTAMQAHVWGEFAVNVSLYELCEVLTQ
jgi:hypothetical protein